MSSDMPQRPTLGPRLDATYGREDEWFHWRPSLAKALFHLFVFMLEPFAYRGLPYLLGIAATPGSLDMGSRTRNTVVFFLFAGEICSMLAACVFMYWAIRRGKGQSFTPGWVRRPRDGMGYVGDILQLTLFWACWRSVAFITLVTLYAVAFAPTPGEVRLSLLVIAHIAAIFGTVTGTYAVVRKRY